MVNTTNKMLNVQILDVFMQVFVFDSPLYNREEDVFLSTSFVWHGGR